MEWRSARIRQLLRGRPQGVALKTERLNVEHTAETSVTGELRTLRGTLARPVTRNVFRRDSEKFDD